MKLSLLVLTAGKQEGKCLEIKLPQFLIGRDQQCQLRPASALISKRHCAILQRDGKAFVRDFNSTNGTFINDEQVEGEAELHHGDELKIGPIAFKVQFDVSEQETMQLQGGKPGTATTPVPPTKALGAKPAGAKSDTPPPATVPPSDQSEGKDDDIAAMLLELEDGERAAGVDSVPEGSTVFDVKVPPQEGSDPNAKPVTAADKNKPAGGGAKGTTGDTRSAAARILEKMTRRPRS
jgi:pSer/pThr/pTyr-binding forkhead associated (FHA) protein